MTVFGPIEKQFGRIGYKCVFCGSYRCKNCQPGKLKRVRARICEIAQQNSLTRFATLTLDPTRIPDKSRSDRYLRNSWRKMRVTLARKYGASVKYFSVLEYQKSGIAHLHVLFSIYIPQDWLSDAWESVGGGRIVDIRYVDVHRVAGYLATYLSGSKIDHTLARLPRRARIFSASRSISMWGKKKKTGWMLARNRLWRIRKCVKEVYIERYEQTEALKPFDLEILTYFEGSLTQAAILEKDPIDVLKICLRAWNPPKVQLELL
jgi:hypothetical protein